MGQGFVALLMNCQPYNFSVSHKLLNQTVVLFRNIVSLFLCFEKGYATNLSHIFLSNVSCYRYVYHLIFKAHWWQLEAWIPLPSYGI